MTTQGETGWLDQAEQRSWRAFIVGSTLLLDKLDHDLRQAYDITLVEYEILVRLSESPDRRMRMALLADSLCHSRSRVTHTVARMEGKGLIKREACDSDGRGVEAVLTQAGEDLLVAAAPLHVRGVRQHFIDLAPEDDFAAVGRVFDSVTDELMPDYPAATDIRSNA